MSEPQIVATLRELKEYRLLHALYQAMYRVHGDEQIDWLRDMPRTVADAYMEVQGALRDR